MKKALIIGASSGIGKELAITLAREGFTLGLMARRIPLLEELQKQLNHQTEISHIDLSKPEDAIQKTEELIQKMGGIDLMIINSGTGHLNQELDWEKEKDTINVNVTGFTALAGLAYNHFLKQGKGHIVGISSIASLRGNSYAPAYHASKAFMSNYLEGLRKKAFQDKVSIVVTDIKPGFVDTDMAKGPNKFWVASPHIAAEQIYSAIKKRRKEAYITRRWALIGFALKWMPDWIYFRT